MKHTYFVFAVMIIAQLIAPASIAETYKSVDLSDVTVCPAAVTDIAPPAPQAESCVTGSGWAVDPQHTHIWAIFDLQIDQKTLDEIAPASLVVSAKASSQIYLNGERIAANGEPADDARTEVAGRMDFVTALKPDALKLGQNTVALRLSSHSGWLHLRAPIHGVFVTRYKNMQDLALRRYWPSFLPFGAFALGALYFAVMAVRSSQGLQAGVLSMMSIMAAAQLLAEVSRGLFAYTYPFHDLRLLAILLCSASFGFLLAVYVLRLFEYRPLWRWLAIFALVIFGAAILPGGFDTKASFALLAPTILASLLAFNARRKQMPFAILVGSGLAGFAVINLVGAGLFLDYFFYYAVAALMIILFAQQARAYANEQALLVEEQARAEKLEFVLSERGLEPENFSISVSENGRITPIPADQINFISGAGDYSEITLRSGQKHLHNETLAQLTEGLPNYFLKVHRSHIVNTRVIERLERNPAGTGKLFLHGEQHVPVSRRIMPLVREALA